MAHERSKPITRGTGCVNCARPGLRGVGGSNPPSYPELRIKGRQDIQSKTMITLFGLFAEIERDLISERTKQALVAASLSGSLFVFP